MNNVERVAKMLAQSTPGFEAERLILNTTELILRLMAEEGVTRTELARRIGKSKGHISQLLNGDRNMTLRTLAEISHALGHRIRVDSEPLSAERSRGSSRARDVRAVLKLVEGGGASLRVPQLPRKGTRSLHELSAERMTANWTGLTPLTTPAVTVNTAEAEVEALGA